jgi:hypothetical protein
MMSFPGGVSALSLVNATFLMKTGHWVRKIARKMQKPA